ncbi:MAG: hypothetical protein ABIO94_01095 [Opitutaceae bacterium]
MLLPLGFATYESHAIARDRSALEAENARLAYQQKQLVELRRQRDEARRDLESATDLLAAEDASSPPSTVHTEKTAPIDGWLTRAKRLKRSFEQRPDQSIPELQLLTDLDWLALARQMKSETEDDQRQAWAKTRDAAYHKFATVLGMALREYRAASNGTPLSDLSQLSPYFKPPIDAAILQRYEIADEVDHSARGTRRVITERVPVDVDFDTRNRLSLDGRGGGSSLWSLETFRQAYDNAMRDFYAANPGRRPTADAGLLPYVRDPTVKEILNAMIAYPKEHNGASPDKSANLRPYVTDPAARSLLEKMITVEERRSAE